MLISVAVILLTKNFLQNTNPDECSMFSSKTTAFGLTKKIFRMKTKCYSVRLQSLVSISDRAYKATAFDGSTAVIPKSQVFDQDFEVQKSEAAWIAAFILEKDDCKLQYSDKKVKWFNR